MSISLTCSRTISLSGTFKNQMALSKESRFHFYLPLLFSTHMEGKIQSNQIQINIGFRLCVAICRYCCCSYYGDFFYQIMCQQYKTKLVHTDDCRWTPRKKKHRKFCDSVLHYFLCELIGCWKNYELCNVQQIMKAKPITVEKIELKIYLKLYWFTMLP